MDQRYYFKNMQIGNGYEVTMLLGGMAQKTAKNGNPYMELSLSDGEENVIARKFSCTEQELISKGVERNNLVKLMVTVNEYNGGKNYSVSTIRPAKGTTLSIADFIMKAPIDEELAFEELIMIVQGSHEDSMHDLEYDSIAHLTEKLLTENKDAFCRSSAAKMVHHNLVGGLLYHTYCMVKNAEKELESYPTLDKELLICGTALHDIGKIREMSTPLTGSAEYTSEGRLLGHAAIGIMMIDEEAKAHRYYDPERVKLLQHMIASHHGQLECGAITTPAIPEATVLHALDMIDSRIFMYGAAYKDMNDGMLSGNIYGLENSSVYKAPPAFAFDESNEYWEEQVRADRVNKIREGLMRSAESVEVFIPENFDDSIFFEAPDEEEECEW